MGATIEVDKPTSPVPFSTSPSSSQLGLVALSLNVAVHTSNAHACLDKMCYFDLLMKKKFSLELSEYKFETEMQGLLAL